MNTILCGMPRCGKSTLGRLLSKRYKLPLVETDKLLQNQHGQSTRDLYREVGEEEFRRREEEVVAALKGLKGNLISLGGGTLESSKNRKILRSLGSFIYLKVEKEVLKKRLRIKEPIFLDPIEFDASFEALWVKRVPIFEKLANIKIEMSKGSFEKQLREYFSHHNVG